MADAKRTKAPGIKPRTLMDIPLGRDHPLKDAPLYGAAKPNLEALAAAFDDMAKRPVRVKRYGLRLLIRRACYAILART